MCRNILLVSFLALALISCEEQPTVEPAMTTFTPAPTATSTLIPSPTPSPTPLPTPTVLVCDQDIVREALGVFSDLEFYRTDATLRGNLLAVDSMTQIITIHTAYVMNEGEIEATELTIDYAGDLGQDMHAIVIGDTFYLEMNPNEWEVARAELASAMLDNSVGTQLLIPELVNQLDTASCMVAAESLDGREADHYQYEDVDLSRITDLSGLGVTDMGITPSSVTLDLWLTAEGDFRIPARMVFALEGDNDGRPFNVELTLEVQDVNVPIEISVPEVVAAPSFVLDIPLVEDAQVHLEGENFIRYFTALQPDEVYAFYEQTLTELGWTVVGTTTEEAEGATITVVEYRLGTAGLEIGAAEQAGQTIVVIFSEETP